MTTRTTLTRSWTSTVRPDDWNRMEFESRAIRKRTMTEVTPRPHERGVERRVPHTPKRPVRQARAWAEADCPTVPGWRGRPTNYPAHVGGFRCSSLLVDQAVVSVHRARDRRRALHGVNGALDRARRDGPRRRPGHGRRRQGARGEHPRRAARAVTSSGNRRATRRAPGFGSGPRRVAEPERAICAGGTSSTGRLARDAQRTGRTSSSKTWARPGHIRPTGCHPRRRQARQDVDFRHTAERVRCESAPRFGERTRTLHLWPRTTKRHWVLLLPGQETGIHDSPDFGGLIEDSVIEVVWRETGVAPPPDSASRRLAPDIARTAARRASDARLTRTTR